MTISNVSSIRQRKVQTQSLELIQATLGQEDVDLLGRLFPIHAIEAGVEAMLLGDEVGGFANHGLALLRGHGG